MGVWGRWLSMLSATLLIAAAAALPSSPSAHAEECILHFESEVRIRRNGTQVVTETIHVAAEGKQIRHGIYRDFPIDPGRNITFRVLSVAIDGEKTAMYETSREASHIRVKMGDGRTTLSPGDHVFVLTYETSGHLRFFGENAELGWNVTGDRWAFPIMEASCIVFLPQGGEIKDTAGWTGVTGAQTSAIDFSRLGPTAAVFTTQEPIRPGTHFTVAVQFPGNLVSDPEWARLQRSLIVLIATFSIFFIGWWIWGRDLKPGTIIPLFYPPEPRYYGRKNEQTGAGLGVMSAAAASYVKNAAFLDLRAFASLFVSLAARGLCRIEKSGKDKFVIVPLAAVSTVLDDIPPEEAETHRMLIAEAGANGHFELSEKKSSAIRAIHDSVIDLLGNRYASLWTKNIALQAIGWLVVFPLALIVMNRAYGDTLEIMLPSVILTGIVLLAKKQIASYWTRSLNQTNPIRSIGYVLFAILYIGYRFRLLPVLLTVGSGVYGIMTRNFLSMTVPTVLLAAIPMFFCPEMKAPSRTCRRLMDKIDGLLMYIGVAEKDRLKAFNPPDETPRTFERLLPYAVAFGLEETWCSRFANQLSAGMNDAQGTLMVNDNWRSLFRLFRHSRGSAIFGNSLRESATLPKPSGGGGSFFGGGGFGGRGGGGAGFGGGGGGGGGW